MSKQPSVADLVRQYVRDNEIEKLVELLESAEIQCAGSLPTPVAFPFYSVLLAAYYTQEDSDNARLLWKRIPQDVKSKNQELSSTWAVGQALWKVDWALFYKGINSFGWSGELGELINRLVATTRLKVLEWIPTTYSSITIPDLSNYLGESLPAATEIAQQQGWTSDGTFVYPTPVGDKKVRKTSLKNLRQLTEYVVSLEN